MNDEIRETIESILVVAEDMNALVQGRNELSRRDLLKLRSEYRNLKDFCKHLGPLIVDESEKV